MAFQIPPSRQGNQTSVAAVFKVSEVREFFKTLLKDLYQLRNTVDALASVINAQTINRMFTFTPAAKAADDVHASYAADTADVKAELDLATEADGDLDTIIEATTAGAAGNDITVAAIGDSATDDGVTISRVGTAFTIHYESGVSTVTNVETAIAALAGDDDLFGIKTGGTGATVLTAPADDFEAVNLADGSDGVSLPGAFTDPDVPRNLRVTFSAAYDGGDMTVVGTDQFDAAQTEEFEAGDDVLRVGTKIFKTVTSATLATLATAGTVSVGTGDKIGVVADISDAVGLLAADGVAEEVTIDADEDAFTPTTAPDGSVVFTLTAHILEATAAVGPSTITTVE